MTSRIRVVALAIVRRPDSGDLLVFEGEDPSRSLTYHRPFGGGVEFGEPGAETVRRELLEEIGVAVHVRNLVATFESFFEFGGVPKHEVVLGYDCAFVDPELYGRDRFDDLEGRGEHGLWRAIDDPIPLFPETLSEMLKGGV